LPISPARESAFRILLRVESGRKFAVDLLQAPEVSRLREVDRRLATELVMGVLRWRGELDFQIEQLSGKPLKRFDREVVTILRLGIYQICFLEKVPKAAAVNESVELAKLARKRSAAGLVNAVLRKCQPLRERIADRPFDELSARSKQRLRRTFPSWLLERWEQIAATTFEPGVLGALKLAHAFVQSPRTTLRVVDPARDTEEARRELDSEGVAASCCVYSGRGLVVESGHVQASRAYREGRVVIQDEASQLVAELVLPRPGQRVLDLCAAPGIKAGQIAQTLGRGLLVACDSNPARLHVLLKLLPRWVPPDVQVHILRLDATQPLPLNVKFDRVLLDAPCSGTGTIGRNPEIKWRLRPEDITRLAERQASMLRNARSVLADEGRLVYATCSLEPEENEMVVEKVLGEEPGFRVLGSQELGCDHPELIPLFDSRGYFCTRPDQHRMDGFFAAVIVRE
jgi:16S rRNA (cytosine967-C5)-methyltransferase